VLNINIKLTLYIFIIIQQYKTTVTPKINILIFEKIENLKKYKNKIKKYIKYKIFQRQYLVTYDGWKFSVPTST
jgi:hypothetical protein